MATIQEILDKNRAIDDIIKDLKETDIEIPEWDTLEKEYNPLLHPVMDTALYQDIVDDGVTTKVSRVVQDMQRLAVKRMTELAVGIPVKRNYYPKDEQQKEVAKYFEAIFARNRIDSVNIERCNQLYASCLTLTLWYAKEERNSVYGFDSPLKLRCRNYSPMLGHHIYILKDEYSDVIAISVGYEVKQGTKKVECFHTYTSDTHTVFVKNEGGWERTDEPITIGKIPAVFTYRPAPIWENTSQIVYEIEWAMSRQGNYIRANSKPAFGIFSDEDIDYGSEKDYMDRLVLQLPKGSDARFITWEQSNEAVKMYVEFLRSSFFTQLQLPEFSFETMKTTPMSGEARKMIFIDAQLKVKEEAGRLLEMFDREVNVVRAFLHVMLPSDYAEAIDALEIECEITPFTINDERERIENIVTACGGKPIASQQQGIALLGWSDDVDKTLEEIRQQDMTDLSEPSF